MQSRGHDRVIGVKLVGIGIGLPASCLTCVPSNGNFVLLVLVSCWPFCVILGAVGHVNFPQVASSLI